MCHTYVGTVGYVCYECQKEFKEYLAKQNIKVTTDVEINDALKIFMKTDKGSFERGNEMSVDEFFTSHSE
jgi:hypothetical protein